MSSTRSFEACLRAPFFIGICLLASVLTACVTINIYFPAAAAEKAADKIIDEVWRLEEGKKPGPSDPSDRPSTPSGSPK
jgi:hypothetical protein